MNNIVAQYPVAAAASANRMSWPIRNDLRLSAATVADDFPFYLPFVNREHECKECVDCFREQFDEQRGCKVDRVTEDNALKNYTMVISAGGPGIGQSCSDRWLNLCSKLSPAALRFSLISSNAHCVCPA